MNEVFLMGKIITDIDLKFIINSKNISIALFKIELLDRQRVKVKAYNEQADYCYRWFRKNDLVFLNGKIERDEIVYLNGELFIS